MTVNQRCKYCGEVDCVCGLFVDGPTYICPKMKVSIKDHQAVLNSFFEGFFKGRKNLLGKSSGIVWKDGIAS